MITKAIEKWKFHQTITKGVVSLIPKDKDLKNLNFWRPITLLRVMYKIFAKNMQLRLQPTLMEVNSLDQSTFLPLQYILNNIVIVQESLH